MHQIETNQKTTAELTLRRLANAVQLTELRKGVGKLAEQALHRLVVVVAKVDDLVAVLWS